VTVPSPEISHGEVGQQADLRIAGCSDRDYGTIKAGVRSIASESNLIVSAGSKAPAALAGMAD
jgi:hypothetical protein